MSVTRLDDRLSVSPQITPEDVPTLAAAGFRTLLCHRPDGEANDQPLFEEIARTARAAGLAVVQQPLARGRITDDDVATFRTLMQENPGPVVAYCRSGTRTVTLWALSEAAHRAPEDILAVAKAAGFDMSGVVRRIANGGRTPIETAEAEHDVVIIGGGAAGIAVASSLLAQHRGLDVAVIDPADIHYYQAGWTLVGGGVFAPEKTVRTMASVMPREVTWYKGAVAAFEPEANVVLMDGCRVIRYRHLVVCPGLKVNWHGIEGLVETLGRNGVTSNYRYDLAPYTWELVSRFQGGRAVFTQPPMPIKCAGAPQKAMYLSADHWRRTGVLDKVDLHFFSAGAVLFGKSEFVPALMRYVERYGAHLNFRHDLVTVDGPNRRAWFRRTAEDGSVDTVEAGFDLLHVVPPQQAPDFVRASPLADASGWVDVEARTLRHTRFANVHALGDVSNAPNAKTAAAARKQAPVVARNLLADMGLKKGHATYDGYGSCPLTVERGKVILAEFGYDGKLLPSLPSWIIDGQNPSRLAWLLKERILPPMYWQAMLKGREWGAKPHIMR